MIEIPEDFDWYVYNQLNLDLRDIIDGKPVFYQEEHAKLHYMRHGFFENRKYKVEIPIDFDWYVYNQLNPDLRNIIDGKQVFYQEEHAKLHYTRHGFFEGRKYKTNDYLEPENPEVPMIHSYNIIIYVLCYNQETYENAMIRYEKYIWAKPILMKYQDYQFENAFWKQLLEISNEWSACDMVGTISHSAFKKIKLDIVNDYIINKRYYPNTYVHLFDTFNYINTVSHEHLEEIWIYMLNKLNLLKTTESCCNYFMCKPVLMREFIYWYLTKCFPEVKSHPLIFENSNYRNVLSRNDLIKLWGNDFYPYYPFVCERLNKSFFITNYKMVFLISFQKTNRNQPKQLLHIQKIYQSNNIRTLLLYLTDIEREKIDIISYISRKSQEFNCSPIVICDSLECYNIAKLLSTTNILTYWYIRDFYQENYPFLKNDFEIFKTSLNIIFKNKTVFRIFEGILELKEPKFLNYKNEEMVLKLLSKPIINCI